MNSKYHKHRMKMILKLIPKQVIKKNNSAFDFGCGDGTLLKKIADKKMKSYGCDPSKKMVLMAREKLNKKYHDIKIGSTECLQNFKNKRFDIILSLNVLAYLSHKQEKAFYAFVNKRLKKNGFLIVTHSNNLFDLFTLNKMTVAFFKKFLVFDQKAKNKVSGLLRNPHKPKKYYPYNIRENPLSYPVKLAKKGLITKKIVFFNHHSAPPLLKNQKTFNPISLRAEDTWKLNFICSTFGITAQKA